MPTKADLGGTHAAVRYAAAGTARALLVLAHGAGAGQRHPFMVAVGAGLAARGIDVVTFDFPYMQQRRSAPDKPAVLEEAFRGAIQAARTDSRRPLFIGGKSMGGRIATHLAAQQLADLSGVIVFGYPLHPPGKPDQLRVAHLPSVRAPLLIAQGERDTFGTPQELAPVLENLAAPVTLHVVKGADHSLKTRTKNDAAVLGGVLETVSDWILARL
jgi:predicted alpha/beta-hydrolase family hydrolase